MRTFRIFPESVWNSGESRKTFKAGRARSYPTPKDIFDEKFDSLKDAVNASLKSSFFNLVVCKRTPLGWVSATQVDCNDDEQ